VESHVHLANLCVPWKIASGVEYLVLQAQHEDGVYKQSTAQTIREG
jgi:hypothetical protein